MLILSRLARSSACLSSGVDDVGAGRRKRESQSRTHLPRHGLDSDLANKLLELVSVLFAEFMVGYAVPQLSIDNSSLEIVDEHSWA